MTVLAVNGDRYAADNARVLERDIVVLAARGAGSPRDALVVHRALVFRGGDIRNARVGSSDELAAAADNNDLAAFGWRIEVDGGIDGHACLALPDTATVRSSDVHEGSCP